MKGSKFQSSTKEKITQSLQDDLNNIQSNFKQLESFFEQKKDLLGVAEEKLEGISTVSITIEGDALLMEELDISTVINGGEEDATIIPQFLSPSVVDSLQLSANTSHAVTDISLNDQCLRDESDFQAEVKGLQ